MRKKLKELFTHWAYLDATGIHKKEDTYFYRFSHEIGQSNLRMMRSMSIFMLLISILVIASTFTYYESTNLRKIYIFIIFLEILLLILIQKLLKKEFSYKIETILTSFHLLHMLAIAGYIGVVYCKQETALIFIVVLTISSMIYTLPTMLTMSIATLSTFVVIIASYYIKESYWFESDVLNGICVLIFSFLFGWKVNQIRAEEAFAKADVIRLNKELTKISVTDTLTGLYNHRSFQDNYYEMFHRANAKGLPLGIIMMDLDKFKTYNDGYGHVAGDDCLSRVANAIANAVPSGVMVCRYGGEEFIALLHEDICYEVATIGEEIQRAVRNLKIPHAYAELEENIVTLSIGAYVGVPSKNDQPMSFVEKADKAMYQSKKAGRNRLTVMVD